MAGERFNSTGGYWPIVALAVVATPSCADDEPAYERVAEDQSAIIGGVEDNGHEYVVGVGDGSGPWCSGTLISRQTVVTAAHCALGITRVYFGKFGQTSVNAEGAEVTHPEWTGDVPSPDVALVKLANPSTVQPAPLLRAALDDTPTYIGPDFTFVGFGVTNGQTGQGAGTKRQVMFPITAIGPTTTMDGIPVSDEFLYYEHATKNTCFGDSGGPTFFINAGVENHAAVTSWGDEFCVRYGVQARTDQPEIDQWIQATIEQFEGMDVCSNDGTCEESCNVGTDVMDPDCQAAHCAADGLCAKACVAPVDPDCPEIFDPCGQDDFCNAGCVPVDPDCPMVTATSSSGPLTAVVSATSSGATTSTSGAGGDGPQRADPTARRDDLLYGRACTCGLPGSGGDALPPWLLAAGLLAGTAIGVARRNKPLSRRGG